MKALARWFSRRHPAVLRRQASIAAWDTPAPQTLPDELAPPKGCAWYDSSLDLQRGLVVRELARPVVSFVV